MPPRRKAEKQANAPKHGPLRRVIPPGWDVYDLTLTGDSPLLMNSSEFDRMGATYRAFKALGAKRGKSVDDEQRLAELEFALALHYDEAIGVFIPGLNVKELLRQSATKWRKGEEVRRSLIVPSYRIALTYDGPRTADGLWKAGYFDVRMVANAGAGSGRVPRCRPMFTQWTVETDIAIDPEDLDADMLANIVDRSVKYGFGDGRNIGFGAFRPSLKFDHREHKRANVDAVKPRRNADGENLEAAKARLMPEPETV